MKVSANHAPDIESRRIWKADATRIVRVREGISKAVRARDIARSARAREWRAGARLRFESSSRTRLLAPKPYWAGVVPELAAEIPTEIPTGEQRWR